MEDNFTSHIRDLRTKYLLYADDYYHNATLVFRLIYDDEIFDRYSECVNEFNSLKGGLYSDKKVEKALNSKKDKSKLAKNILYSRAMGCLAIADAIEKLEHNFSCMTIKQIRAYENLIRVRNKLVYLAKISLQKSNEIALKNDYPPVDFDVDKNYPKM